MSRSLDTKTFPTRPAEITAGWLTSVLRHADLLQPGVVVNDWTVHDVGAGVGMMGEIVRLELACTGPDGPTSVIAKFPAPQPENRAVAVAFAMYEREARFYADLATLVGDAAPSCYHTDYDPESNDMVIVFEDLGQYRSGDQEVGIDLTDARLALGAVARLHAKTWNAQADDRFSAWPRVDGPLHLNGFGAGVAAAMAPAFDTFASAIPDEVIRAGDAFRAAIPALHERMSQGAQCLGHGDFRADNFMFGTAVGHRPFVMLDFQNVLITKPVHDVAYLLTQSIDPELRRAHEEELLHGYLEALTDEGFTDYSYDECWGDYRLAALHCFEYAIVIAGGLDPSNERGRRWIGKMLNRSAQAIVDLDLVELLS